MLRFHSQLNSTLPASFAAPTPTPSLPRYTPPPSLVLSTRLRLLCHEDALTWFEHARDAYEDDKEVFTVSVYGDVGHHPEAQLLDHSESMDTARRQHFTPWGWGTWKDRYDDMAHVYTGWDGQMNFEMVHINQGVNYEAFGQGLRKDRYEVFPVLSRANNIGMEDGIHSKWFKPDKMKVRLGSYFDHSLTLSLARASSP